MDHYMASRWSNAITAFDEAREGLDDPPARAAMSIAAEAGSRRYAWSMTAARLRRLYADLVARDPVSCR